MAVVWVGMAPLFRPFPLIRNPLLISPLKGGGERGIRPYPLPVLPLGGGFGLGECKNDVEVRCGIIRGSCRRLDALGWCRSLGRLWVCVRLRRGIVP